MAKTNRERQAAFKARQVDKGKQQLAVFVSDDAYLIIKRRAEQDGITVSEAVESAIISNFITSNEERCSFCLREVSQADGDHIFIKGEDGFICDECVDLAKAEADERRGTSNLAQSDVTAKARDLKPVELKARELKAAGLSLRKIGDALAEAGFVTRKGTPHGPAAIRAMLTQKP